MTTFGHLTKKRNSCEVKLKVRVEVVKLELATSGSDKKFMVWLQRKGKARGTGIVNGNGLEAIFGESITLSVTLYRDYDTGLYSRKRFSLVVFAQKQDPGCAPTMMKKFGRCEIDVSHSSEVKCVRLRPAALGEYVDAKIWYSVSVDDRP